MRSKLTLWLALVMLVLLPALRVPRKWVRSRAHTSPAMHRSECPGGAEQRRQDALYTFTTDQNGDYKGDGIKPTLMS